MSQQPHVRDITTLDTLTGMELLPRPTFEARSPAHEHEVSLSLFVSQFISIDLRISLILRNASLNKTRAQSCDMVGRESPRLPTELATGISMNGALQLDALTSACVEQVENAADQRTIDKRDLFMNIY